MKPVARLFIAIFLLSGLLTAASMLQKEHTHDEAIGTIMELSGLNVQVPQVSEIVMEGMGPLIQNSPEALREKMTSIIAVAFKSHAMLDTVHKEVSRSVSLTEAKAMLAWFLSDVGREITRLEEVPMSYEEHKSIKKQRDELMGNTAHVSLCKKIDKIGRVTQSQLDMQIGIMRAIIMIAQPTAKYTTVETYLNIKRKEIAASTREQVLLHMLYTYRSLDEAQLRQYVAFLSKSTTQTFLESASRGITRAIIAASEQMFSELEKIKPQPKAKP